MSSDIIRLTIHPDNTEKTIAITTINAVMTFIMRSKTFSTAARTMNVRTRPMTKLDQGTPDSEDVFMCGAIARGTLRSNVCIERAPEREALREPNSTAVWRSARMHG